MTRFDILVLALVLMSGGLGWLRGGLREGATVAGIVVGFIALSVIGPAIAGHVSGALARGLVLLAVFAVGYGAVTITAGLVIRQLTGSGPTMLDQAFGVMLGALRGWLLAAFCLFTVQVYHVDTSLPPSLIRSLFAPALDATLDAVLRKGDGTQEQLPS